MSRLAKPPLLSIAVSTMWLPIVKIGPSRKPPSSPVGTGLGLPAPRLATTAFAGSVASTMNMPRPAEATYR
ncbi:hypothetical protein D9M69_485220 [compost metagenome]